MASESETCALCEQPIKGKVWEIDGMTYCSACRQEIIEGLGDENLTDEDFSSINVDEIYPTDSKKLGRIVVSMQRQEKELHTISGILKYFLVISILGLIGSIIYFILILII